MDKKQIKIIASMVIFIMMCAYLSTIGEVLAMSLESQTTKINNTNIEFDSYFIKDKQKIHTDEKKIEEENHLYTAISLKEAGYLKNIKIEMANANFKIAEKIEDDHIEKVEGNTLFLGQMKSGDTVEIAIPIQLLEEQYADTETFHKTNSVVLTAIHVDGNGKEKTIEKEIEVSLTWKAEKEAELNMQIAKFIPYHINGNKGVVLQTIVKSYLKNNQLPVKENQIEISVPTINNVKPKQIKVTANTTKATNGDETGMNFTQENYAYNEETNKLTIQVNNPENEQGQIVWQKEAQDEFVVTYVYAEEALNTMPEEGAKITIEANSKLLVKEAQEETITKHFVGEAILKDPISNLVDFSIQTKVDQISKGQIYANKQANTKLETEYQEMVTATVGLAELTDKIVLTRTTDNFLSENGSKMVANYLSYYKVLELDKQNMHKILGEEGSIQLYVGTTLVKTINKETEENEQGKIIVNLADFNTDKLTIETSKPQTEGNLNIVLTKAIKGDIPYANYQIKEANKLELNLQGKAINAEMDFVNQVVSKEITLTEPMSQAELSISNSNLSTVVTNENVKITAILKTDTLDCMLYHNPTLTITLPAYIQSINIKNIELLFETEASKLNILSSQLLHNPDGSKSIFIRLDGFQSEYTLGAVSKGINIVITADITPNKLTPNKQDNITMTYSNSNLVSISRSANVETNQVSTPINFVAPSGMVTTSSIRDYKNNAQELTSISGEEKTATIDTMADSKNPTFTMNVINNYNNSIDNVIILGRTPFKGNTEIDTGKDLNSTMDLNLSTPIQVNGVDPSKIEIYYSENAQATKDLTNPANAWTTSPANLHTIKSYCIVLKDHTMNSGDMFSFNYSAIIPANLQHNQSAYENYVVYFNNNLATGMITDKQASAKIGVTTGRGPVLEAKISSNTPENQEVLSGNVIKYTLSVKNTGTETAHNVSTIIPIPEQLQLVEPQDDMDRPFKVVDLKGETSATISLGDIQPGNSVTKEIYMLAGNLLETEDTKLVEIGANIVADNISGQIQLPTLRNTIARTHYIVATSVMKETEILKENDAYTYYIEVISSDFQITKEDTTMIIQFPEEIEYQGIEIKNRQGNTTTDITNSISSQYDSKTRTLTIPLGEVSGETAKGITLKVKIGTLEENVYDKTVTIQASVSGKDARMQPIEVKPVQIGKIGLKVTQTSNIPQNTHITAGEDLKFIFTIENLSSADLYNVKITDILPEELTLNSMKIVKETGKGESSYENSIKVNLKGKEKITLEVNVSVKMLPEEKTIANKAKIEIEGITPMESNTYTIIIDKFDEGILDDENKPNQQRKRIMGTVWIDKNQDGQRQEEEEILSDVPVLLFNNKTGDLVRNDKGEVLKTTTDKNGNYTFSNLLPGSYTVIFLYDTANYSATAYRKEGVDETVNSDAVDSKITLDGVTRVAGITEEIKITDSNRYNIDLGLVSNPKFDLKLDKFVSRITVQDSTGAKTYEYNDSKLAKRDLVGKQINNTTIIVEYKMRVTNEGAISGYVKKIADYMPSEMKFNSELNKDWYTSGNGILYNSSLANTLINPGESKEVTLLLTKKLTENNVGLYNNTAEIYESYNDLGIADVDSTPGNKISTEDDISSADVLITVKTGETILVIGLSLTIIATIAIGAYVIKKKVLQ